MRAGSRTRVHATGALLADALGLPLITGRGLDGPEHGETVHAACHLLLQIAAEASPAIGFGTDHTALTRFEHRRDRYGNERRVLTTLNDTAHLAPPAD
ncbi:hypothetical protein [Streptomyces vietnamensis]|uniref:Uncharacterized protein n=1 Tax=Streptomyces vietnamensis TaxID=362257 RepID=A0A0B5HMM0_9ACTN|nr:hypothetical protein [Streptomyces vietnamensis]AJF63345.1 hypothetical protein SVTN_01355 [Streptomyces vietnamensis]